MMALHSSAASADPARTRRPDHRGAQCGRTALCFPDVFRPAVTVQNDMLRPVLMERPRPGTGRNVPVAL